MLRIDTPGLKRSPELGANSSAQINGQRGPCGRDSPIMWCLLQGCEVVRALLFAVLMLFEPAIRAVSSLAMLLGLLAAIVCEISAVGPIFEFLEMHARSLGLGIALTIYYGLLALVSR